MMPEHHAQQFSSEATSEHKVPEMPVFDDLQWVIVLRDPSNNMCPGYE
jgi:hypothetical protein